MKNNHGVTLAEVLVSIVLISIVVLFLFRLLVILRRDDSLNENKINVQIIEDSIVNAVQNDIYGLGVQYIYLSNTKCTGTSTNCCCTGSTGTKSSVSDGPKCLKIFYSNNQVKELSIYQSGNINGENNSAKYDSIKYGYLNRKLPAELQFGTITVSRTKEYKSNYRFDTLTWSIIPILGLDENYNLTLMAPSVYYDGRNKC